MAAECALTDRLPNTDTGANVGAGLHRKSPFVVIREDGFRRERSAAECSLTAGNANATAAAMDRGLDLHWFTLLSSVGIRCSGYGIRRNRWSGSSSRSFPWTQDRRDDGLRYLGFVGNLWNWSSARCSRHSWFNSPWREWQRRCARMRGRHP